MWVQNRLNFTAILHIS